MNKEGETGVSLNEFAQKIKGVGAYESHTVEEFKFMLKNRSLPGEVYKSNYNYVSYKELVPDKLPITYAECKENTEKSCSFYGVLSPKEELGTEESISDEVKNDPSFIALFQSQSPTNKDCIAQAMNLILDNNQLSQSIGNSIRTVMGLNKLNAPWCKGCRPGGLLNFSR